MKCFFSIFSSEFLILEVFLLAHELSSFCCVEETLNWYLPTYCLAYTCSCRYFTCLRFLSPCMRNRSPLPSTKNPLPANLNVRFSFGTAHRTPSTLLLAMAFLSERSLLFLLTVSLEKMVLHPTSVLAKISLCLP